MVMLEPRLAVGRELWLQRKVCQTSGDSDGSGTML
jgi:hypothetical protein